MLTPAQKNTAIFVATIAAAVFGGIQLWPSFATLFKPDSPQSVVNTANAPGGVAIAGGALAALPSNSVASTQITINNGDPKALEFLKQEIIGHEQQKQVSRSLEIRLAEAEQSLELWKFWYFRSVHPSSIDMLKDLAALQFYVVRKDVFDARWANIIQANETRNIYINDILVRQGWATVQDGFLRVSESGLSLLKQSGLYIQPYAVRRSISPSFDCRKADKWYEKLICSDEELAVLDVEMAKLFKQLQNQSTLNAKLINSSQVDWRNNSRNVCTDRNSLIESYSTRISQLRSMISR